MEYMMDDYESARSYKWRFNLDYLPMFHFEKQIYRLMKHLRRFNESQVIKASDGIIREIVMGEIDKLGDNADLNHIDVSEVLNMTSIFDDSKFNGDISQWKTGNVELMWLMFRNSKFNGDISKWEIGKVKNMIGIFESSIFNRDISNWNVGNVTNMYDMFRNSKFNGDISRWNVGNVVSINGMFYDSHFNGNIDNWKPFNLSDHITIGYLNRFNPFYNSPLGLNDDGDNFPLWYKDFFHLYNIFENWGEFDKSVKMFGWVRDKKIYMKRSKVMIDYFDIPEYKFRYWVNRKRLTIYHFEKQIYRSI